MELLKVDTLEEAIQKLVRYAGGNGTEESGIRLRTESVAFCDAVGCTLADDIVCEENIPPRARSVMDGYAVRSADTSGASEGVPSFLNIVGEVEMGKAVSFRIKSGECAYIPTGGFLPEGCDAVVMLEDCESFGSSQAAVYTAVSPGRNIVQAGDDMKKGEIVIKCGKRLDYADIGVLAAVGKERLEVYRPWRVHVISTGDEIVPPEQKPSEGQMRDVNSHTIAALARKYGFETSTELLPDDESLLEMHIRAAMESCDIVAVSGGSSQGKKDATAKIIDRLASSGVLTHGIAVKPGKPTIIGFDEPSHCVLLGLPGHPVAAVLLFDLIAGGLWKEMSGESGSDKPSFLYGRLDVNLPASPGRKTFQLVKIFEEYAEKDGTAEIIVRPVYGKSGLIRTLAEADGYIVMEVNEEGLCRGTQVRVQLLR